jgi:RNA polymerase sigma-70 factor, ECF subfamily
MAEECASVEVQRLVAEHHQAVYRYAYRLTGSVADAEDLTQHVFLVAQDRLGQLRTPHRARSWLYAILRNRFFKTCQRSRPVPATTVGLDLDSLPGRSDANGVIDSERLQQAIGELPPAFRVVLVMFYFENCSYKEIAAELDLPIGTVMSRLARAKQHLRSRLVEAAAAATTRGI